jgi:chemotaxis signal transduction protein
VSNVNSEFIVGIAKIDKRLVILLDLSKVLSTEETTQVVGAVDKK